MLAMTENNKLLKQEVTPAPEPKAEKEKPRKEKPFKEKHPVIPKVEPTRRIDLGTTARERPLPKRRKPAGPETTLQSVNKDILTMFQTTVHMLEETLRAGKLNPAQGLLGMVMVADLLHGGAYNVPNNERPSLVGNKSPYYGGDEVGPTNFYPVAGFNIFDIFTSIFTTGESVLESGVGAAIAKEVYLNANVPHKFPKLLSDEAYAKILVMCMYLSHSELVLKNALGVKTFVEGEAQLITAEAGAVEKVAGAVKDLKPLLSLLEGA
jgi:hypothetical protein